MGHIFKIESNQAGTITANVDWTNSNATPYNKGYVDGIPDTTTTQKEITSIPSPFARIELVKEAFDKIVPGSIDQCKPEDLTKLLHGKSIYHKTVSDTLDVAQIFFSYQSMQDKVDILVWNRNNCINALKNSKQDSHQIVGKTLDMYLTQDAMGADPYNFGKMQDMYILKYKGPGHKQMHIIGATSPATLFFSTANDENAISKHLCFGTDYAFDRVYASLDKRDPEFVKYLFALRYSEPQFNILYPEVAKYMDAVYNALNDNTLGDPQQEKRNSQLQNAIDNVKQNINVSNAKGQGSYLSTNYDQIQFTDVTGKNIYNVEVNGMWLYQKRINVNGNSDFQIASSKPQNGNIPLVLPITNSPAYSQLVYYGGPFGKNQSIPAYDPTAVAQRRLPGIDVQHPYLTISDFLDDKIIKLPANVNSDDFFDGNFSDTLGQDGGYLLPILPGYFNYFNVDDLKGNAPSGKKTIEIRTVAGGGVEVTLRIPIQKGNEVEYKRIYTLGVNANKANNQGAIVIANEDTMVGVFPPVKFANPADAHYRVALLSDFGLNTQSSCQLHNDAQGFFTPNYVVRNVDIEDDIRSKVYFLDGQTFDCIRVSLTTDVEGSRETQGDGLIVPKFKKRAENAQLNFAIDLGTSNTHIEYTTAANTLSQSFSYNTDQPQMCLVCKPSDTIKQHLSGEFVPEIIGVDGAQCHFPMRTVLGIDKNNAGINGNQAGGAYLPLGNASPAFMYNKADVGLKYNDYVPNLKWRNDPGNDDKVRCFIESLLLMIRTKVIYEGGSVSQTQIKWFYPISMSNFKKSLFEDIWVKAYQKYFNPTGSPISITESIAPYSYFQSTMASVTDVVTIDIGGGTTDIVVADSQGVKLVTSMRFAADAIFGNSLIAVQNGSLNGIIKQFKDEYINNLRGLPDLQRMLVTKTAGNRGNSSEVASFLFSLVENEQVKKENLETQVDFNLTLKNDSTQKVVFYIFYTAIIYHLAHLMKAKGLPAPRNIAFSGNGSKVVSILSPNKATLEGLTAKIFDLIYDVNVKQINLIINSVNPKEATCKGGLLMTQQPQDVDQYKAVLLGADAITLVDSQKYSGVSASYRDVEKEVKAFMNFIMLRLLGKGVSLNNDFGISQQYVELAVNSFNRNDLKAYIDKGVDLKLKSRDVTSNDVIEETLFFYPIIGVINDLSEQIYSTQLTQQTNMPN